MLPGTFANFGANFVKAAPRLKNNGYCVFAMNYGNTIWSNDRVGGLDHVENLARQLADFVTKVRAETGAKQVDILGHSQGGTVPLWYMNKLGGASQVAHYVGWAPSSHGTTLNGLAVLADQLNLLGFTTGLSDVLRFPGVLDQAKDSEFTKRLWAGGDQVPDGPKYTVISTKTDRVVTPYESQKLNGRYVNNEYVNNIVLQDRCPTNLTGHATLFVDDPTLQLTMNALADGPPEFQPNCATPTGLPFA